MGEMGLELDCVNTCSCGCVDESMRTLNITIVRLRNFSDNEQVFAEQDVVNHPNE